MWTLAIDIQSIIADKGGTNGEVRAALSAVSRKLCDSLPFRLLGQPEYDPEFQAIIDEIDSLAVLAAMQPTENVDTDMLGDVNTVLLRLYDYGDKHGIWLG